jgi:membrane peptidoglycan carboxypeptidase
MRRLGINTLLERSPDFGITTMKDASYYGKGLSLVLGTAEISPLQMADAYSTFANNGKRPEAHFILEVRDKFGKVLFKNSPEFHQVVSPETAFLINSILSDNNARSEEFGSLLTMPFPAAVKTGTTENYRDAWTIGYNPSLVVAVWVGNNDARPIYNLPGSLAAAPIWKDIIGEYVSIVGYRNFERPDGIVRASFCDSTSSGSARMEYFTEGTEPHRNCVPRKSIPNDITKNDENLPHIGGSDEEADEGKPTPTPEQVSPASNPTPELKNLSLKKDKSKDQFTKNESKKEDE